MDASSDTNDNQPTPRMLAWAKNSAAYRLAKRMMTERELADAIKRKARTKFEDITEAQVNALAETALAFGRSMKALDDQNYAEIRANSAARSGRSKRAIARKLAEKGVDKSIVTSVLLDADDLRAAIVYARKKAFGPFRRPDVEADEARWTKEISSFARQGFSFDLAKRVLDLERDEAEDILLGSP
ncbi:regulatory protein [Peteryoungia aggregata LMG 23059]|uniref:Regulatory protein RecX n=1 Tax=Peteryoungia aggregata LMG 23059 TaxID=1368425 RepID=A0ABU0G627_9HYPH|nr:regulatory protein RecX [Peteryoungia aggregata]MDQ0420795.1 regulatory protein [Peteryoungia aggregata LMG 23059]